MRIDHKKVPFWYRWLPENKRLKAIRGYEIEGEESNSDKKHTHPLTIIATVISFLTLFILINYVVGMILDWIHRDIFKQLLDVTKTPHFPVWNPNYLWSGIKYFPSLVGSIIFSSAFSLVIYKKFSVRFDSLIKGGGQKGDGRLATIEEIKNQYPSIPDSKKRYDGIGGLPICHYQNQYFIETATTNSLIIGASRSGKGEMIVVPMIDILARASDQSSMVVNDPKGELYASSKDILEKYGYEVQILNLFDPLNSMSFNPLQIIKEAYLDGELDRAEDLTNSFSHMMFDDPNAGQNAWVNKGAEAMCTGLILGLLEKCEKDNDFEKFNLYNVGQMLVELGKTSLKKESPMDEEKSYLDAYFDGLPEGDKAKAQYASSSLGGGNGKRTIVSSVVEKFRLYQLGNISKMTSKNSFELKSLGFPKYVTVHFDPALKLYQSRVKVEFISAKNELIMSDYMKPNLEGVASLNFDCSIESGDMLKLSHENNQITFLLKRQKNQKEVILKPIASKLRWNAVQDISMKYSEKPIAVFMVTPDYDTSKNPIATTFVDQVYDTLMKNASLTRGKKCHRRVHFLLDEFGNMPALSKLENKLTVCLSRNVLFNLILQSYDQLYSVYGKEIGHIAKENCQNKVLIKTDSSDTIKEFQQSVGKRTVESVSRDRKVSDLSSAGHVSVSEEDVLPYERISDMLEGEMLVIRKLHRQDNERKRIRAYPIFDTGETSMPYRFQFLSKDYDMDKDIIDLDVHSDHRDLDIKTVSIDFEAWRKEIRESNNKASVDDLSGGIQETNSSDEHSEKRNDESFKQLLLNRYPYLNNSNNQLIDNFLSLMQDDSVTYEQIKNTLSNIDCESSLYNCLMEYVEKYK